MSFNIFENSLFSARPVELYRFSVGATSFTFCSSDEDITYGGEVYKAVPISRGSLKFSPEIGKTPVEITTRANTDLAALYIAGVPDRVMRVQIFGFHKGDDEYVLLWQGRVTGVVFEGVECKITGETSTTSLKRMGLRPVIQSLCRHTLYGPSCRAAKTPVECRITLIAGAHIGTDSATDFSEGWGVGGYIVTDNEDVQLMILESHESSLRLSNVSRRLTVGQRLWVYPGCDHTVDHCRDKFDNEINFGGFPWMPEKNPYVNNVMY